MNMSKPLLSLLRAAAPLAVAALLAGTSYLNAQSAVSNFGQGSNGTANIGFAFNGAPKCSVFSFTTGSSISGYDFSSFTLAFSGSTTLAASATYYLLLSAPSASTSGRHYTYKPSATVNEDGGGLAGWTIGDAASRSLGGAAWTSNGGLGSLSIRATAAAIPEPSTSAAMAGAAMLGLDVGQRRRRTPSSLIAS